MGDIELAEMNPLQENSSEVCWRCHRGTNNGELVSPCKCTGLTKFIHVDCLERTANNKEMNALSCDFCYTRYPLEKQRKSLLECCRDRNRRLQILLEVCKNCINIAMWISVCCVSFYFACFFLLLIIFNSTVWDGFNVMISILCLSCGIFSTCNIVYIIIIN